MDRPGPGDRHRADVHPGNRYRDAMTIGGQPTIVRQSDGIHLNDAGSALAEQLVLAAIDRDFTR